MLVDFHLDFCSYIKIFPDIHSDFEAALNLYLSNIDRTRYSRPVIHLDFKTCSTCSNSVDFMKGGEIQVS